MPGTVANGLAGVQQNRYGAQAGLKLAVRSVRCMRTHSAEYALASERLHEIGRIKPGRLGEVASDGAISIRGFCDAETVAITSSR